MSSTLEPVPEGTAARPQKRPVWVWIISLWCAFSFCFTLFGFVLVFSGAVPLTPPQQAYFAALGPFDHFMTLGLALLTLTAALLLFLMRRAAAPLFVAAFVVNVAYSVISMFTTSWAEATGGSGLVGALFGWIILGAVAAYSWRLRRDGTLK